MDSPEIDTGELVGLRFRCIEGCGFCCLCQPEVLAHEARELREKIAEFIVPSSIQQGRKALAMQGRGGACSMLKDRKCTIYEMRPHFCRQFPVHTHVLNRIQLTADLSCRGVQRSGGEDLETYGIRELGRLPRSYVMNAWKQAMEAFAAFRGNAEDAGVWASPAVLRKEALELIKEGYFESLEGLSIVLHAAEASSQGIGFKEALKGSGHTGKARSMLEELFLELTEEKQMDEYPLFVDKNLEWKFYSAVNGAVVENRLLPSGKSERVNAFEFKPDGIRIDSSASAELRRYAEMLNRRDAFLGFVCFLVDDADYETDMRITYFQNLAVMILDLIMRSALLCRSGRAILDSNAIQEGIVFMDMDVHDAPTIGAVV